MSAQIIPRKPGRPNGSKTRTLTFGMKQAMKYNDLVYAGVKPTQALKELAGDLQVPEETIRRNTYKHDDRVVQEIEKAFQEFANQFGDSEKAILAMREVREWIARMIEHWKAVLPAELAALESQDAIHARLSEVVRDGLLELSRSATARAKELANESGSDIDPAIPHAAVAAFVKFAEISNTSKK